MEYLFILALLVPVAFGLAIRNALSLDRHYAAVYDRQKEAEAAEKARQAEISARLTPGKFIPRRGPGEDQELPEVPQWIQDWTDVMEGRKPAGDSESGNRPADVHEFPAGGRRSQVPNPMVSEMEPCTTSPWTGKREFRGNSARPWIIRPMVELRTRAGMPPVPVFRETAIMTTN